MKNIKNINDYIQNIIRMIEFICLIFYKKILFPRHKNELLQTNFFKVALQTASIYVYKLTCPMSDLLFKVTLVRYICQTLMEN
jgi:hypothetical protein